MITLPRSVSLEETVPDYPVLIVRHPKATARIALNGAHVMEWTPVGQQPVLYLSPQAVLEPGKPIRGGVPICWPWFNVHPTDASKPMHGFARIRMWELAEASETEAEVKFVFGLTSNAETLALWPQPFRAQVEIKVGRELAIALTTENTGVAPVTVREALHTYLAVGDIQRVTVRGLADTGYLDTVGTPAVRHQEGDITFDREVDRQYASQEPVTVDDPAWRRRLVVEKEGSGTTVVWNPWIEKSKRLADLPDEAYHHFLCVEAANAGEAAVVVSPGETHRLATRITVQ